ncbi:MAG: hypothetical protein ABS81_06010 [Pseudonocardia sp. SCN 72-86]|nr:MAG: hypothetical protein ABS81_06010 [Pseudonocardia sp. SCN 72-86]
MTSDRPPLDVIVDDLMAGPVRVTDIRARVPSAPGLYTWWARPAVLPHLVGPRHPDQQDLRLLYVGLATKLRSRLVSNHLRRSGSSTLRRTLAGLLLDEQGYRTHRTDRAVLVQEDAARLTAWMDSHLQVSWREHPTPRDDEGHVIRALRPPLNVDHAAGPALAIIKAARRHYYDSAGPRPQLRHPTPASS